jgi:hypothetical protein
VFGLASISLQKKTKVYNEYLCLTYNQTGVDIECLFKNVDSEQVIGNIVSVLNRLKIESNIKECAN